MLEFFVQSGPDEGKVLRVGSPPATLGRSSANSLALNGPGVWDRHAEIGVGPDRRFQIQMLGDANGTRGDVPCRSWSLRNGESFQLGGVRVRFSIASVPQRSLSVVEAMGWLGLGLLLVLEAWLAARS